MKVPSEKKAVIKICFKSDVNLRFEVAGVLVELQNTLTTLLELHL